MQVLNRKVRTDEGDKLESEAAGDSFYFDRIDNGCFDFLEVRRTKPPTPAA
jgi:hypothetical protein